MTIAQQLNVTKFPFRIKDDKGNEIYTEGSNGYWSKSEYNDNGKQIYFEHSDGLWWKSKYDDKGNQIYFENSNGYWSKYEYDDKGNPIYNENSDGYIMDNRPKSIPEYTMEELINKLGYNFKIKK
jgi:hypothetical protein